MIQNRWFQFAGCLFAAVVSSGVSADAPDLPPLPQSSPQDSKTVDEKGTTTADEVQSTTERDKPPEKLSAGQIQQLVDDLGSETFAVRTNASRQLLSAGAAALTPLTNALADNDTEVRLRAFKCLEELFSSDDAKVEQKAWLILEQLCRDPASQIAERSRALLNRYGQRREKLVLDRIQQLNGIVQNVEGSATRAVRMVAINSDWKGGDETSKLISILGGQGMRFRYTVYLIDGHPFSKKAVGSLEAELTQKDIPIATRGPASLGIRGGIAFAGQDGCIVGGVQAGAAKDAGIREHDIIVKFGPDKVDDFFHLVELIRKYDVGDKVEVQLSNRKTTVTLGSWLPRKPTPQPPLKPPARSVDSPKP